MAEDSREQEINFIKKLSIEIPKQRNEIKYLGINMNSGFHSVKGSLTDIHSELVSTRKIWEKQLFGWVKESDRKDNFLQSLWKSVTFWTKSTKDQNKGVVAILRDIQRGTEKTNRLLSYRIAQERAIRDINTKLPKDVRGDIKGYDRHTGRRDDDYDKAAGREDFFSLKNLGKAYLTYKIFKYLKGRDARIAKELAALINTPPTGPGSPTPPKVPGKVSGKPPIGSVRDMVNSMHRQNMSTAAKLTKHLDDTAISSSTKVTNHLRLIHTSAIAGMDKVTNKSLSVIDNVAESIIKRAVNDTPRVSLKSSSGIFRGHPLAEPGVNQNPLRSHGRFMGSPILEPGVNQNPLRSSGIFRGHPLAEPGVNQNPLRSHGRFMGSPILEPGVNQNPLRSSGIFRGHPLAEPGVNQNPLRSHGRFMGSPILEPGVNQNPLRSSGIFRGHPLAEPGVNQNPLRSHGRFMGSPILEPGVNQNPLRSSGIFRGHPLAEPGVNQNPLRSHGRFMGSPILEPGVNQNPLRSSGIFRGHPLAEPGVNQNPLRSSGIFRGHPLAEPGVNQNPLRSSGIFRGHPLAEPGVNQNPLRSHGRFMGSPILEPGVNQNPLRSSGRFS